MLSSNLVAYEIITCKICLQMRKYLTILLFLVVSVSAKSETTVSDWVPGLYLGDSLVDPLQVGSLFSDAFSALGDENSEELLRNYEIFGNSNVEDSSIFFLPEHHHRLDVKLQSVKLAARLAQKGDVFLFEGRLSNLPEDCFVSLINHLTKVPGSNEEKTSAIVNNVVGEFHTNPGAFSVGYSLTQSLLCEGWEPKTDGSIFAVEQARKELTTLLKKDRESKSGQSRLEFLAKKNIDPDDIDPSILEIKDTIKFYKTLMGVVRNKSLVRSMKKYLSQGRRVFIFSGIQHCAYPDGYTNNLAHVLSNRALEIQDLTTFLKKRAYVILHHKKLGNDRLSALLANE